jgi:hypothetical protein
MSIFSSYFVLQYRSKINLDISPPREIAGWQQWECGGSRREVRILSGDIAVHDCEPGRVPFSFSLPG